MRLQKLTEAKNSVPFETVLKQAYIYALPFLKETAKKSKPLFMYSGRTSKLDYFVGNVRKDRRPTDTSPELHEHWDKLFYEKFGWYPRSNSIFVTNNRGQASGYGTVYMIFPNSPYKYLWSPMIGDLYGWAYNKPAPLSVGNPEFDDKNKKRYDAWVDRNKKGLASYTNKNLTKVLRDNTREREIMVNTKRYIAVNYELYGTLFEQWFSTYGPVTPTTEMIQEIERKLKRFNFSEVPIYEG